MNKTNLLQKIASLGVVTFSSISITGIAVDSAQAIGDGELGWQDTTSSFIGDFDVDFDPGPPPTAGPLPNVDAPDSFNVTFTPTNFLANIADLQGEFEFDFGFTTPPPRLVNVAPATGNFDLVQLIDPVDPATNPYNEFEYELDGDLAFVFQGEGSDTAPNGTIVTIKDDAIFLGEVNVASDNVTPEGIEFELLAGDIDVFTNGQLYTVSGESCGSGECRVIGEVFEFEQAFNTTVGTYTGQVSIQGNAIPEPATILGLLTLGGMGLGLKRKKQS